ncbi:MAG: SLBB domain-containing protein [Balneolaceae bacterium]
MSILQRVLLILPFLLFSFVQAEARQVQLPGGVDITEMESDQLSDAQVREIDGRIQEMGISLDQFSSLAVQRGANSTEVSRLVQRIRQLRVQGEESEFEGSRNQGNVRMENVEADTVYQDLESDRDSVTDSLRVFGSRLFEQISRTFQPSFNIPTPRNYTIGAGDQIIIDVWGAAEMTYQLVVNAEGSIRIQSLGPIYLNGLTIEEASERIKRRLSDIYSGLRPDQPDQANTYAEVSLGNVRSIKVTVMGEVKAPGTYTVSSLSTVFNALFAAGGPGDNGTYRNVQIIRGNDVHSTFDLYDIMVSGNQEGNINLKDQDIIKVDPYENRVQVVGETKRVGLFETKDGETLEDLIRFAGGFTDRAYTDRLVLKRRTPTMRSVSDVKYPEGESLVIRNGDRLEVGRGLQRYDNRVTIRGAVFRPGDYELEEGMTLHDLLMKADGPREDAHFQRGVIFRTRDNLVVETVAFSLRNVLDDPETYDFPLRKDDEVRIASLFELRDEYTFSVSGAVNNPSTFDFTEGMTLEDALFRANGLRDESAAYRIEVARRIVDVEEQLKTDRVAEVFQFSVDEDLDFSEEDRDFTLQPYDQVFVRLKPNYQPQQKVRIEGEVQFPGEYVLEDRTARLSDLIGWAGGLSDYAYPRGASLERIAETANVEDESFLGELVEENDRGQLTTRVGIRLRDALQEPHSNQDLILEEGDVIRVPKQLQTVRIEGEVLYPVSIRYEPGKSFQSYINEAGGITEDGRRNRAYVVYANGEVDRTKRFLFIRNNPSVEPGATIIIPPKPASREMTPQERISLASSIASTALLFVTLIDRLN